MKKKRSRTSETGTKESGLAARNAKLRHGGDVGGDGHASAAAGPAVRRLARELGVDLRRVRPASGGRITEEDVRAHVRASNQQAASSAAQRE